MAYVLTTESKGNYLHLKVTGRLSPEAVAGYMTEGLAKCAELGIRNVLIEENLEGPDLDLQSLHAIVSRASEAARPLLEHVAFVNANPRHDPDLMRFAEHVAVNRAMNVRIFRTVPEAERWLAYYARKDASESAQ